MPQRFLAMRMACLLSVLALSGCREEVSGLTAVRGRVTLDGQPLLSGSVSLRPEDGMAAWERPTGMIDAQGNFVIYTQQREGAPPGKYRVIVFATEAVTAADGSPHPGLPRSLIPARYNDPAKSPLHIEVPSSANSGTFDLELMTREK